MTNQSIGDRKTTSKQPPTPKEKRNRSLLERGEELETRPRQSRMRQFSSHPLSAVLVALAGLLVIFTILNGRTFGSVANARNLALDGSITLVLAVGITFVIITAGIDLSVGSVLVFAGVVSAMVMRDMGTDTAGTAIVGVVIAIGTGLAWGLMNGLLIAALDLNPIIVTLASFGSALGMALVVTDGIDIVEIPASMLDFANLRIAGIPAIVLIAASVVLLAQFVLTKTAFGRHTYAIGSNPEAARRAGIHVKRHLVTVYGIAGACAGLAAWMSLARFSTTSMGGHMLDPLNAITAALLGGVSLGGGLGTAVGAAMGTFIPVVLTNGLVISGVQSYWQQVIIGIVLIAAVYLDKRRRKSIE